METDPAAPQVISRIVSVLAVTLVLALVGLVVTSFGGDQATRATLTHVIETLVGVFVGIAAARLASH